MLHRLRVPSDQTFRPARLSLFSVTSRDTPRYIWYVVRKEEHGDFTPFAYSAHVDKIINHTVSKGKKANGMREGKAINIVAVHRHVVSNVESLAKRDGS